MRLLNILALVALTASCFATKGLPTHVEAPTSPALPVLESHAPRAYGHNHGAYGWPVVHMACQYIVFYADHKVKLGERAYRDCFIDAATKEHPAAGPMICPVCNKQITLNVDTIYLDHIFGGSATIAWRAPLVGLDNLPSGSPSSSQEFSRSSRQPGE